MLPGAYSHAAYSSALAPLSACDPPHVHPSLAPQPLAVVQDGVEQGQEVRWWQAGRGLEHGKLEQAVGRGAGKRAGMRAGKRAGMRAGKRAGMRADAPPSQGESVPACDSEA